MSQEGEENEGNREVSVTESDTCTLIWLDRCSFLSPGWVNSICRVCLQMSKRAHLGSTHLANVPKPSQLSYSTYTVAVLLLCFFHCTTNLGICTSWEGGSYHF